MYCGFVQTRQKSGSETDACVNSMPSLYDVARGITLWEFLRLKVRKDSDRPHSAPRLAQMIGEFDALMQQLRSVVQDQLVPVSPKTGIAHHASKILVVSLLPALFSLLIFSRTPLPVFPENLDTRFSRVIQMSVHGICIVRQIHILPAVINAIFYLHAVPFITQL